MLYQLANPGVELSPQQVHVLKKEAAHITFRLENKKESVEMFSEKFTHLAVGDLSVKDRERLNLGGSDLGKFAQFPLTDLILELVHLLDPKVYEHFEKSIMRKYYSAVHGLPE